MPVEVLVLVYCCHVGLGSFSKIAHDVNFTHHFVSNNFANLLKVPRSSHMNFINFLLIFTGALRTKWEGGERESWAAYLVNKVRRSCWPFFTEAAEGLLSKKDTSQIGYITIQQNNYQFTCNVERRQNKQASNVPKRKRQVKRISGVSIDQ